MFLFQRFCSFISITLVLASCTINNLPDTPVYEGNEDDPTITFNLSSDLPGGTVTFFGELNKTYFQENGQELYFNSVHDYKNYLDQHPEEKKFKKSSKNYKGETQKNIGDAQPLELQLDLSAWEKYEALRRKNSKWVGTVYDEKTPSSKYFKYKVEPADRFTIKIPSNTTVIFKSIYINAGRYCIPSGIRFETKAKTNYLGTLRASTRGCVFYVQEIYPNGSYSEKPIGEAERIGLPPPPQNQVIYIYI